MSALFEMRGIHVTAIIMLSVVINCHSYRILGIFNIPSKSMYLPAVTMANILEERGHTVTIVCPYRKSSNYSQHIFLSKIHEEMNQNHPDNFEISNPYLQSYLFQEMGLLLANMTYAEPAFQQLLKMKNKFDLVILDNLFNESLMYVAEHLGIPLILYSSLDAYELLNAKVGNPASPSFIPMFLSHYSSEMTFLQRLDNTLLCTFYHLYHNYIILPKHDYIVKTYFPHAPHISNYYNKAAIVLLNTHYSFMEPIPKVPCMIDIGGFHIEPVKPLPEDIENILNGAKHGVIYFSMGTNLKTSHIANKTLEVIIKSLSVLNQTVLWKWDAQEFPNKPTNFVVRKWFPQNDILAHKNVRLFISHGGLHGLMETIYHGVPTLIIPVFADQIKNAIKASRKGYASYIPFPDISIENMTWHLNKLLNDPRYIKKVTEISNIMKDELISQKDKLIYWVEYVIRHKGAEHLKVASLKLNWFQFFLLDVTLFIIGLFAILFVSLAVLKKRIMGTRKSKTKRKLK